MTARTPIALAIVACLGCAKANAPKLGSLYCETGGTRSHALFPGDWVIACNHKVYLAFGGNDVVADAMGMYAPRLALLTFRTSAETRYFSCAADESWTICKYAQCESEQTCDKAEELIKWRYEMGRP